MTAPDTNPLQFPCEFPIKAMGEARDGFDALVFGIVRRHAPDLGEAAIESRSSRGGKYLSVTVTVQATSREQLDSIYRDLTGCEQILVVL